MRLTNIVFVVALIFLFSCDYSNIEDGNVDQGIGNDIEDTTHTKKVSKIFYNVPPPIEMTKLIQESGAEYIEDILNSPENQFKYLTTADAAINLGVYGADLSYTRMFDQIQKSISYLSSLKTLSDELGIPNDEGSMAVSRLEDNMANRDSILQIITDTYSNADAYLKESDRGNTATLVILGGWVEALYIATSLAESTENKVIIKRIAEQKYSLNNLIELLKFYKEDKTIAYYIPKLLELKKVFDKITITYTKGDVITNKETKMTIIDSKVDVIVNIEQVKEIHNVIIEIRNEMINL
jgi:hypothetical protein